MIRKVHVGFTFTGSMFVIFSECLGAQFVSQISHLLFDGVPVVVVMPVVRGSVTYMHVAT